MVLLTRMDTITRLLTWEVVVRISLVLVPLAIASWRLTSPMEHDEAVYMTIGRELRHGLLPYRDLFDHKPPFVYLWYGLVGSASGDSLIAVRLGIALWVGMAANVVLSIARHFYAEYLAIIAAGTAALCPLLALVGVNASADQLAALPALSALLATLSRRSFLAGVLMASAVMFKPVVIPEGLVLLLLTDSRRHYLAGGITVGAVVAASLTALGLLPTAYDALITFNREYGQIGWRGHDVLGVLWIWPLLTAPVSLLVLIGLPWLRGRRLTVLGSWAAAALIGSQLTGHQLPYYVWTFLPAFALLVPVIIERIARMEATRRRLAILPLAFALTLASYPSIYLSLHPEIMGVHRRPFREVAALVHGPTWVGANIPQVYMLAPATPAERYFQPAPLDVPRRAGEAIDDLAGSLPLFLVVDDILPITPDLEPLIAHSYDLVARFGTIRVLSRHREP